MTDPTQRSLDDLFAQATQINIFSGGASGGKVLGSNLLSQAEGEEIPLVQRSLSINERETGFHCMCHGDLAIELKREAQTLAVLGFHHGLSLRYEGWSSDVALQDGRAFLVWLSQKGITAPLLAFDEAAARSKEADQHYQKWLDATPESLRGKNFTTDAMGLPLPAGASAYQEAQRRLEAQLPSAKERTIALLSWLSFSSGPWSGYPSYEGLPLTLLRNIPTEDILQTLQATELSEGQMLSAARHFASHEMVSFQKAEVAKVPEALWKTFLGVVQKQGISDNKARLEYAHQIAKERKSLADNLRPHRLQSGIFVVGISDGGPLQHLRSDGTHLFSYDYQHLLRFSPDSIKATPLYQTKESFVDFSYHNQHLYFTEGKLGLVGRVSTQGGAPEIFATEQQRPMYACALGEEVFWLNLPFVPHPELGAPYSVQRSQLMRWRKGEVTMLFDKAESAYDLSSERQAIYWAEQKDQVAIVLNRFSDGAIKTLTTLREKAEGGIGHPRPLIYQEIIYWWSPASLEVRSAPQTGGASALLYRARKGERLEKICVDDSGVYVLVGNEEGVRWRIERITQGETRRLVTFEGRVYHAYMTLDAERIYWVLDDKILAWPKEEEQPRPWWKLWG